MKWPESIMLIRHGQSEYNALREKKQDNPFYQAFLREYDCGDSPKLVMMAKAIRDQFALRVSDYDTPLSERGRSQARTTGRLLNIDKTPPPEIVLVSPYLRTRQTLEELTAGWPALASCKIVPDDRIREQEHGLSLLYNDWRIFHALHPEQRELRELMGPYWYQYPQGESVPMVRDRNRSITETMIREYAGKKVLLVTHHVTILCFRANYERLSPEQFIDLDENQKPVNCGVTLYRGEPDLGWNGRLVLDYYNKKLY
ncbi:MAG TPA: histidine phosphatase family protein [Candidatus Paceibacterota bacterium]|nr:histidine phosphatase family protein [Candidatus Paceibacterota bacterium]